MNSLREITVDRYSESNDDSSVEKANVEDEDAVADAHRSWKEESIDVERTVSNEHRSWSDD